jgi:GntR family transcriptional repressor for pyruvate dehydrogenase complex
MLVAAVAEARSRVSGLLDRIPLLGTNIEHSNQQHHALVDAILSGDPEAAREISKAHLEGTASLLRGFLS